ncbi:carboxypeptidase-like regulatory domain-containing protein [Aquimarina litoralis]|uniref:carboxypeptidase-like regulatory domain-containing protein n=1 Tax=Aquimarina litoralis TaxID=584605 RepID=UPI001C55AC3D|nr:carboxypeptidase-like regulatory domain-containing protein [Aquimarina litoralis]MBW1295750.1 hypothetical protein [Aquimarina litoralis]
MRRFFLLVFITTFLLTSCEEEEDTLIINVEGRAIDDYTNEGIMGVEIYVYDSGTPILAETKLGTNDCPGFICTTTDENGNYTISFPDQRSYGILRVSSTIPENYSISGINGDIIGQVQNGASNSRVHFRFTKISN